MSSDESSSGEDYKSVEEQGASSEEEPTTLSDTDSSDDDQESAIKPLGAWKAPKSSMKSPSPVKSSPQVASPQTVKSPVKSPRVTTTPPRIKSPVKPASPKVFAVKSSPSVFGAASAKEGTSKKPAVLTKTNRTIRPAIQPRSKVTKTAEEEEKDFKKGQKILINISDEDLETFLAQLGAQMPENDIKTVNKRVAEVKWSEVAFGEYDDEMCRCLWSAVKRYTRNYRVMGELIKEVQSKLKHPKGQQDFYTSVAKNTKGFPKSTSIQMSGYHAFANHIVAEQRKEGGKGDPINVLNKGIKEKYDALPESEKEKWSEIHKKATEEYKIQLDEFYKKHPIFAKRKFTNKAMNAKPKRIRGESVYTPKKVEYPDEPQTPRTPFELYVKSKMKRKEPSEYLSRAEYRERWKETSISKKFKYINKAIKSMTEFEGVVAEYKKLHPGYNGTLNTFRLSKVLNQEDVGIWIEHSGGPSKPPMNPYRIFFSELISKEPYSEMTSDAFDDEAQKMWRELDWYKKEMYGLQYKEATLTYRREMTEFYAKAPEFMKPGIVLNVPNKFRSAVLGVPKVPKSRGRRLKIVSSERLPDSDSSDDEKVIKVEKKKKKRKKGASSSDESIEIGSSVPTEKEGKKEKKRKDAKKNHQGEKEMKDPNDPDSYKRTFYSKKPALTARDFQEPLKKNESKKKRKIGF